VTLRTSVRARDWLVENLGHDDLYIIDGLTELEVLAALSQPCAAPWRRGLDGANPSSTRRIADEASAAHATDLAPRVGTSENVQAHKRRDAYLVTADAKLVNTPMLAFTALLYPAMLIRDA
jgi:hypothetical protein